MLRMSLLAFVFAVSGVATHAVESARVITWDDLVPAADPLEDPFADLSPEVLDDLSRIALIEADLRLGFIKEEDPEMTELNLIKLRLGDQGIDVDELWTAAEALDAEIERRGQNVVMDLNGQIVRMPGYALPLEASEKGVKEFLLVPYVGACIHVPPPPPNQTVYVQLDKAYAVRSLYEPVWITGRLEVQASSRALSFVDGQTDVATGYTLSGISIEPYE